MKKICSIIGIVAGVFIIIVGLLTSFGEFGVADSYATSAPYYYDSGFAEFGADYYTYSVNNSAEAAYAARAAADNIRAFSAWIQTCIGMFLIFVGVVDICGFGIVLAPCINDSQPKPTQNENTSNYNKDKNESLNETTGTDSQQTVSEPTVYGWACPKCGTVNPYGKLRCQKCKHF